MVWRTAGTQRRLRRVQAVERPAVRGQGARRGRPAPRPARECGRAVRGREEPDPGAPALTASAADDAGHARAAARTTT